MARKVNRKATKAIMQPGQVADLSTWTISSHALCQAARRMGTSLEEALQWLRAHMTAVRCIDAREAAERLGTDPAIQRALARAHARRRGILQRYVLLAEAPQPVIGVVLPDEKLLVTVLVPGRMLPLVRGPRMELLQAAARFAQLGA